MFRRVLISASAGLATLALAAPALAGPVATSDSQYDGLGAVFPDPQAECKSGPCDPNARGRLGAKSFVGFQEFVGGITYMNQRPAWQRYMEVWPLDGKLGPGAGNARSDVPGNNLAAGQLEFDPNASFVSAGLPRPNLERLKSDLIVVRVTDESVPDTLKKRYALSLSIHGIERAGAEGGIRAMEDLVTAATTNRLNASIVPKEVKAGSATFRDVLQNTIIYFTFPNPDGWRRGSIGIPEGDSNGVYFQRYNGNGVDLNRDWSDIGFSYRYYSGISEPETVAFERFYADVRRRGGPFAAGDDLHGMGHADALSYTLMPHGRHEYDKDLRIREASKRINRAQYVATKWSPLIQDNDKPVGGGVPCTPTVAVFGPCALIYAQTWGTVYDTINYTTTGTLGDWFDSAVGLQADGIDNEMAFSHLDKNTAFDPHTEQLHVAGNKAIIYSHLVEMLDPPSGHFDARGTKAFVPNKRLTRSEQTLQPGPPPGTEPQAPITATTPTPTYNFKIKSGPQAPDSGADAGKNIFNGGMRIEVTTPNFQGIGSGQTVINIECRHKNANDPGYAGCDKHREPQAADGGETDEWVLVAQDYNQSALYLQSGAIATVNYPQTHGSDGKQVEWRVRLQNAASANVKITFTSGPASTSGNTGGDDAPKLLGYDVANTDYMRDLNKHLPAGASPFQEVDPRKVLSGEQSLAGLANVVLADDPLPGFTGHYGPVGPPPAGFAIEGEPTAPGAYSPTIADDPSTRRPGTFTRIDFDIAPDKSAGGVHIRIDWELLDNDFDMYLYRQIGEKLVLVGQSTGTQGETNYEDINLDTPLRSGKYALFVDNWASADFRWSGKVEFKPVDPNPPTGDFSPEERDAWFAKLREYAEGGGNLVLTDGALRALPGITGMPVSAVGQSTVYAGQLAFETAPGKTTLSDPLLTAPLTVNQPGSRFNVDTRRQMYEPTPLGFPIQELDRSGSDASFARQWDIDRKEFEKVPNSRIVASSVDPGARDARAVHDLVAMGEIKLGTGQVRFAGGLLPQPTPQYDHELGLEPYAVTYTGYIVFRNLLATAEEQARGTVAGVTYASSRKPRFLISRRLTRMNLRGVVPVRVSCRATGGCRGTLLIERRVRVRGKKRKFRTVVLGKKTFRVRGKRRQVLRVKLRPGARSSVRRRPRTTMLASAAVAYTDGRRESVGPVRFKVSRPKG